MPSDARGRAGLDSDVRAPAPRSVPRSPVVKLRLHLLSVSWTWGRLSLVLPDGANQQLVGRGSGHGQRVGSHLRAETYRLRRVACSPQVRDMRSELRLSCFRGSWIFGVSGLPACVPGVFRRDWRQWETLREALNQVRAGVERRASHVRRSGPCAQLWGATEAQMVQLRTTPLRAELLANGEFGALGRDRISGRWRSSSPQVARRPGCSPSSIPEEPDRAFGLCDLGFLGGAHGEALLGRSAKR